MIEGVLLSLLGREALDAIKKFFRKKFGHQDDEEKQHRKDVKDIKNLLEKKTGESSSAPVLLTSRPPVMTKLVGRDKELKEVADLLQKAQQVVLVNGLGGVGKTELCKRFFYDNEKEFHTIAWIDYTGSIKESFARQLNIPGLHKTQDETMDERFQKGVGDPGPRSPLRAIFRRTDWCAGVSLFYLMIAKKIVFFCTLF